MALKKQTTFLSNTKHLLFSVVVGVKNPSKPRKVQGDQELNMFYRVLKGPCSGTKGRGCS